MSSDRATIRSELTARLAEVVENEMDPTRIRDDHRLQDDLGLASLDAVMLTLELEERYDIDVRDDELLALDTVAALLDLIELKLGGVEDTVESGPSV